MAFLRRSFVIPFVMLAWAVGCAKPVPLESPVQAAPVAESDVSADASAQTVQGPPSWFTNADAQAGVAAPGCVGIGCDPRGDVAVAIGLANALADLRAKAKLDESVCGVGIASHTPDRLGPATMEFITRSSAPTAGCGEPSPPAKRTVFLSMPGVKGTVFALEQTDETHTVDCGERGSVSYGARYVRLYENGASSRSLLKRVRERCTVELERRPEGRYIRVMRVGASR